MAAQLQLFSEPSGPSWLTEKREALAIESITTARNLVLIKYWA
jgi:hypothetical protein